MRQIEMNGIARLRFFYGVFWLLMQSIGHVSATELLTLSSEDVTVGIDRDKGGAITWLSSRAYSENIVNIADPGRLIQQSYYAGHSIDRTSEGQHKSWSPWPWNPIQGGGVGSGGDQGTWSQVRVFEKNQDGLYSETIPKLWDMPDEKAEALMRQWTSFEPNLSGVVRVRCEFESKRRRGDRWSDMKRRPQEVPACYFTRNFANVRSYLGNGKWRREIQSPGPPWGHATPPRKAMAMFDSSGCGVAVFSPASEANWNYGPHGSGLSDDPSDGPCMHVAPIDRTQLKHNSIYRYRYWLVVGDQSEIASRLDSLWKKYSHEESSNIDSSN